MNSAYLGLIKAHNDFEILNGGSVDEIAMSRTYTITGETLNYYCGGENVEAKEMTAVIDYGGGIWTFRYIISECEHNIGCMDPLATNYDPEATRCDGHCLYLGCTDSQATNYNELALDDDGSCAYSIPSDFALQGTWTIKSLCVGEQINSCEWWSYNKGEGRD